MVRARRALAGQHQRGLAGEGGGDDAGARKRPSFALRWGESPSSSSANFSTVGLAGPGIAEEAEHLLLLGSGLEPLLDLADRGGLRGGWGELGHGWGISTA